MEVGVSLTLLLAHGTFILLLVCLVQFWCENFCLVLLYCILPCLDVVFWRLAFLMGDKGGVNGDRERQSSCLCGKLKRVEGGETLVWIHFMKEKSIFNFKN